MNLTLWVMQAIVAISLIASGLIIMLLPKEKLVPELSWVKEYSDNMRYFICSSKIMGALGLILPGYLNILPELTPITACFIAVFMFLAMRYHFSRKEYKDVPATVIFLVSAIFIACGRF